MPLDDELVKLACARVELHHLPDFLLKGHAAQQVAHPLCDGQCWIEIIGIGFS